MATKKKAPKESADGQAIDANRLFEARKRKQLTQLDLYVLCKISPTEISKLENGIGPDLGARALRRLCLALEVSADHLLRISK